jgi:hypothetical protein
MGTANAAQLHAQSKASAIKKVPTHVTPKECFVWYVGTKEGWEPIPGTGCAHYVSHQIGIKRGKAGSSACDLGYVFRVSDLVKSMTLVKAEEVQTQDIWANTGNTHCGIVVAVESAGNSDKKEGKPIGKITIEHCSSAQGGVVRNDWAGHFHGQGKFYRSAHTGSAAPSAAPMKSARNSPFPVGEAFS